jgi:hypothetical protein
MGYDKDYPNGESIVFRCGRDPGEKAAPEVVRKFARKRDLIAEENAAIIQKRRGTSAVRKWA